MLKIKCGNLNLYDTLFSGQCFRMFIEEDESFTIILSDRVINVKKIDDFLVVDSNIFFDLENVVRNYFDLDRDYEEINRTLSAKSDILKNNIYLCDGYKILKQEKFEMFITYIISQNNNVKRIMGSVDKLSRMYGKKVVFRDKDYYLFPYYEDMKDISLDELRSIGIGFRDSYIMNALDKLKMDRLFLDKIDDMNTRDALKVLTSIKGIGTKVASCILLFAYHRFDTYPIDTWVRHFVSENFSVSDNINAISLFMKENFGSLSGIAIQYFYHIERNKKKNS